MGNLKKNDHAIYKKNILYYTIYKLKHTFLKSKFTVLKTEFFLCVLSEIDNTL